VVAAGTTSYLRTDGGNLNFTGNLSGSGTLDRIGSGSLFLSGDDSAFTGTYVNVAAYTRFNSATSGSALATWTLNGAATINQSNLSISLGSVDQIRPGGGISGDTVSIGGNNQNSTTTLLSGAMSLVKVGSGTLVLNGSNTYSGTTTISAGTLLAENYQWIGHGHGLGHGQRRDIGWQRNDRRGLRSQRRYAQSR